MKSLDVVYDRLERLVRRKGYCKVRGGTQLEFKTDFIDEREVYITVEEPEFFYVSVSADKKGRPGISFILNRDGNRIYSSDCHLIDKDFEDIREVHNDLGLTVVEHIEEFLSNKESFKGPRSFSFYG